MNDKDIFNLPNNVREHFRKLSDADFADAPELVAVQSRLDNANVESAAAVDRYVSLKTQVDQIEAEAEQYQRKADELREARTRLLPDFLLAGTAGDQVVTLVDEIATALRFVEDVALARPQFAERLKSLTRETYSAAMRQEEAQVAFKITAVRLNIE